MAWAILGRLVREGLRGGSIEICMMRRVNLCEELSSVLTEGTAGVKGLKWTHAWFALFLFVVSSRKVSRVGGWWATRAMIERKEEGYSRARSCGAWESWHGVGYF